MSIINYLSVKLSIYIDAALVIGEQSSCCTAPKSHTIVRASTAWPCAGFSQPPWLGHGDPVSQSEASAHEQWQYDGISISATQIKSGSILQFCTSDFTELDVLKYSIQIYLIFLNSSNGIKIWLKGIPCLP
jgi:hypothetical protein